MIGLWTRDVRPGVISINYLRAHSMLKKRCLNGLLYASAVASSLVVALPLIRQQGPTTADDNLDATALQFCATNAPEARVTSADRIDQHFSVGVPLETPHMGMPSAAAHSIAKGEVVQFEVLSPRPGKVAVHGLLDAETVEVGSVVRVAFRAVYTGRFPLHFHGADGSHFEIAALEVLPKSMLSARSTGQEQQRASALCGPSPHSPPPCVSKVQAPVRVLSQKDDATQQAAESPAA